MKQFTHPVAVILLGLGLLGASLPGQAAVDPHRLYLAARGEIPWQSLSPEEQDALRQHRGRWDSYSSERQKSMREGTRRYLELPPEKRRELEQQRRRYQQMSPEERRRLREEYRRNRH